jgi:hypothetical protein
MDFSAELARFAEQKRLGDRHRDAGPDIAPARRVGGHSFGDAERHLAEAAVRLLAWAEVEHDLPAGRLAGCEALVLRAKSLCEELARFAAMRRSVSE